MRLINIRYLYLLSVFTHCVLISPITSAQSTNRQLTPGTSTLEAEDQLAVPETGQNPLRQDNSKRSEVETIFVTAQKREEDVQIVPVAVSVLNTDIINRSYSNTLESLQMLVPTLTFRKGTTTRNSALTLRGVGTISFSIAAEPSVSTVVDGVVMARSGQAFTDLYDLAQIEVLRGPQGTLFGKNASAGAINITTLGGSDVFESRLSATAFEGNEYRVKASVAGPITRQLKGRLTGFFGSFGGNLENIFLDEQVNGYQRYGARGILEYEPSQRIKFKLIADYYEGDDNCCAEISEVPIDDPNESFRRDAIRGIDIRGIDTREVNHNLITRTLDRTYGVSLTSEAYFNNHALTSILAVRRWENTEIREGDFFQNAFVGIPQLHDRGEQHFNQYSLELRLSSPLGGVIDYVAGVFVWRAESERQFTREDIVCTASEALPAPANGGGQPCLSSSPDTYFASVTADMTSGFTNLGAFGQGNLHFNSRFRLVLGARYIYDAVEYTHQRPDAPTFQRPGAPDDFPGLSTQGNNLSDSSNDQNFAAKAALQYDLFRGIMSYISYTRGYKGPAFNVFFNMTENDRAPIDAETSNAFEAGIKSNFIGRRLTLNLTGFYADYQNFQANNFPLINNAQTTTLTNAGDVRTQGFEMDFNLVPVGWLRLSGGLAYTDAKIVEFRTSAQNTDDRAGDRLPLAPEFKASLAGTITFPIRFGMVDLLGNLSSQFSYTSDQFSGLGNSEPEGPIDAYSLWNLSLGVVGISEGGINHSVSFMVRNVLDESFVTLNTANSTRLHIPRDADRYFGMNYTISY